jgi:hypothetical protein
MRSPSQQVGEGQSGTTELIVEPDAEVVQRHPRRQTCSQPAQLVRSLPPEAQGVEELLVDAFYDLADGGHPSPQLLGPAPLAAVALGRADDTHPVEIEPTPMVFFTLEALVGHVGSCGWRSHAQQPGVWPVARCKEGLGQWLIFGGGGGKTETRYEACGVNSDEQTKSLIPSQPIAPSDVGKTSQPAIPHPFSWRPLLASPSCPGLGRNSFELPSSAPDARPPPR